MIVTNMIVTFFLNFQLLLQVGHRCEQQPYLKIKVRRLTHTPQSRLSHIVTMHAASGRAYPSCLLNIEIWIWVLISYGWAGVPQNIEAAITRVKYIVKKNKLTKVKNYSSWLTNLDIDYLFRRGTKYSNSLQVLVGSFLRQLEVENLEIGKF